MQSSKDIRFISLNSVLACPTLPDLDMDPSNVLSPRLTSEKLGSLDVREIDALSSSRPSTPSQLRVRALSPTGSVRTAMSSRHSFRRSSRRSSYKFTHSRSTMSSELIGKAEKKFLALMEIMASASSTASSLKEIWMEIISERESWSSREEELLEQIKEYCETIERTEKEQHHHHHAHEETKKTIESLKVQITSLNASVAEYKRKCGERDQDLEKCRHELDESKETISRVRKRYEDTKRSHEIIQLKLTACEEERDAARADAEKHHHELRTLTREHHELKSRFTEVTHRFESSQKEISILHEKVC